MKKQILNNWLKQGLSLKALRIQKVLSFRNGTVELLNKKHGVVTYFKVA